MSTIESNNATIEIGPLKITFPLSGDTHAKEGEASGEISGEINCGEQCQNQNHQAMPAQMQMNVGQFQGRGEQTSRRRVDVPDVGEFWKGQGGIYAGIVYDHAAGRRWHLIVPVDPAGRTKDVQWGPYGVLISGADNHTDGLANTQALVAHGRECAAAHWAHNLSIDGHDDFYLPARRELAIVEANLSHLFEKILYWSNTQCSAGIAWSQNFDNGVTLSWTKASGAGALAVRRLVIQ